jgi:hypothetical protein
MPNSTFAKLDSFYSKLIESIKEKDSSAFKKDQLLYPWHSTLGKTFNEFRINELNRWKSYDYHCQKYLNDVMMNQRTFDEERVKRLGTSAATISSKDLKDLCLEYNTRYSKFLIKGYDHLIQSLKVSKDPLVT